MRFMTIVKGSENAGTPPPEMFTAVDQLSADAAKQGVMVIRGGLLPSATGARVRIAKGKVTVTDGPFSEAKEVIGGFAIYEVKTKAEMMEWTRRFMDIHAKYWPSWEGEIEIRQMWEEDTPV